MTAPPSTAIVLTKEGPGRPVATAQIVPTVRAGEVVVVPQALQRVGLHRELVDTIFNAIGDVCGCSEAQECRRLGLERVHAVLDGAQMELAVHEANQRLARRYAGVMKALGHAVLGFDHAFYIHRSPLLRFMVPHETASSNQERFMRKKNRGHLSGHPPHRDYWFQNPVNSINVWMAVGAVERENGLLIYTDMWGCEVIRNGTFARDDDYGTPLTFALAPGDVAVFDNRQLHASMFNVSSSTRVVFSGRMCAEWPIAPRADALETTTTFWSPLIGTRFEPIAGAATKLSWTYVRERLKRRAIRAVGSVERSIGCAPLTGVREALRYRRADRPFGA